MFGWVHKVFARGAADLPSDQSTVEDRMLANVHPEQWKEAGPRVGMRNLTHRRTTTEWRGD